jgi:hypothetical protein
MYVCCNLRHLLGWHAQKMVDFQCVQIYMCILHRLTTYHCRAAHESKLFQAIVLYWLGISDIEQQ